MSDTPHSDPLEAHTVDLKVRARSWTPDQPSHITRALMAAAGLTVEDVWVRYFSITGTAGEHELSAHLENVTPLPHEQADILTYAVAELIDEHTTIDGDSLRQ